MKRPGHEAVFLYLPVAILLSAFALLVVETETLWPWGHIVHEDGKRNLLETIFSFEHIIRGFPLDILLGMAVAGSVRVFYPPVHPLEASSFRRKKRLRRNFAFFILLMIVAVLVVASYTAGFPAVRDNLAQLYTRPGVPPVWGNHWRYHFLSRVALMLLGFAMAGASRMLQSRSGNRGRRSRFTLLAVTLGTFGALTFLFGLTTEPFHHPRYIGHQARELFTHALVTLPLALGVCLWLARQTGTEPVDPTTRINWRPIFLTGTAAVLLGLYLALGSVFTSALAQAQTDNFIHLIATHFLEHTFTYLIVPSVAGFFFLWPNSSV